MLTDGLFQRVFHIGAFALNDAKRNAIDKQHQIGAVMLLARASHYAELFGYMKDVVLPVLPVDVLQREAFFIAIDALFQRFAKGDEVVSGFAGMDITVVHGQFFQCLNAPFNVFGGKDAGFSSN